MIDANQELLHKKIQKYVQFGLLTNITNKTTYNESAGHEHSQNIYKIFRSPKSMQQIKNKIHPD